MAIVEYRERFHQEPGIDTTSNVQPKSMAFELRQILDSLKRRRAWIYSTVLLFTSLYVLASLYLPPTYISSARILIDPRNLRVVDREVTPTAQATDANIAVVESQMRVMISDAILRQVITDEKLATDPEFGAKVSSFSTIRRTLANYLGKESKPKSPELKALRLLWQAVDIKRAPGSYVVDLSVSTRNPAKSARIASAIAQNYVNSEIEQRASVARNTSESLFIRLEDLRKKVGNAEGIVESYRKQNKIVHIENQLLNEQQLAQLSVELTRAQAEATQAEAKYNQINALIRSGGDINALSDALNSATISRFRDNIAEARQQERALSTQLRARHPRLILARERIASLKSQIDAELARIVKAAKLDFERTSKNQERVQSDLDNLKAGALDTKQKLVKLRELERKANAERLVYENYLVRAREINEQQGLKTTTARIISPAVPPANPRGLSTLTALVLAVASGIGLGVVLALIRDALDNTIYTVSKIRQMTNLPVLVTLPEFLVKQLPHRQSKSGWKGNFQKLARTRRNMKLSTFVVENPGSNTATGFSFLADLVMEDQEQLGGPQSILVTGLDNNDCKSTVALNLALACAKAGKKVALIDGDRTFGVLTHSLSEGPNPSILNQISNPNASKKNIVEFAGVTFTFFPIDENSPNNASPLSTENLARQLVNSGSDFDVAIIDGGLATTDYSTRKLASSVDDVLVVTQLGVTSSDDLKEAVEGLHPDAFRAAGVVATNVAA